MTNSLQKWLLAVLSELNSLVAEEVYIVSRVVLVRSLVPEADVFGSSGVSARTVEVH